MSGPPDPRHERGHHRARARLLQTAGALLLAVVVLGILCRHGATTADLALQRLIRSTLVKSPLLPSLRVVGSERGHWHGAYLTVLAPLVLAAALLAIEVRRRGLGLVTRTWRWLGVLLVALPIEEILRRLLGRPGPKSLAGADLVRGAYPSGAALLVVLAWATGWLVVAKLQPGARRWMSAATTVALVLHSIARILIRAHWPTDILGGYLLGAAAVALALGLRRVRDPRTARPAGGL